MITNLRVKNCLTRTRGTTSPGFRRERLLTGGDALHSGLRHHASLARHDRARVVGVGPLGAAVPHDAPVHATCEHRRRRLDESR